MTQIKSSIWKLTRRAISVVPVFVCLFPYAGSAAQSYADYASSTNAQTELAYSSINVFGDSLVDAGNLFNLAGIPPSPPYNQKFSNGELWVEPLADELGLSPTLFTEVISEALPIEGINFALAGSLSSDQNVDPQLPGLQQQIDRFSQFAPVLPMTSEGLFVLLAGGNDYNRAIANSDVTIASLEALPNQVTDNLTQAVSDLVGLGAEHLLVANLPDLGQQPFAKQLSQFNPQSGSLLTSLSAAHNALLDQKLTALSKTSETKITQLDLNALFDEIVSNPSGFGFTDTEETCLINFQSGFFFDGVCDNPDEFVFWDNVHPTDAVHQLIAKEAIEALKENSAEDAESVPEPYGAIPLLVVGGAVLFGMRSRSESALLKNQKVL